ncbi:MAG: polymer-forming cytoskeletal protein [Lachnospiraceae bacterium]|nr:polymer-forming cytoskeletal protein [Lachnospiraceae bacterium]
MSFFKDFKEDLSQAVNELLPEDNAKADQAVDGEAMKESSADLSGMVDFSDIDPELLKAIDNTSVPEAPVLDAQGINDPSSLQTEDNQPVLSDQDVEAMMQEVMGNTGIDIPDNFITEPGTDTGAVETETIVLEPVAEAAKAEPATPDIPTDQSMAYAREEETVSNQPLVNPAVEVKAATRPQQPAKDNAGAMPSLNPVEPIFKQSPFKPAPINTTAERTSKETGVITEGMSVTGDIISDGNMDVMGSIKGNITLEGKLKVTGSIEGNSEVLELYAEGAKVTGDIKSQTTVKIGAGTVIRGNIVARGGVFAGAVKGDIDITGPVILDSTAIIMGNIKSKTIQINNGAIIEGLCSQCYAEVSPSEFFDKD